MSTLKGSSLKLLDKFTEFGSNVSPTQNDINTRLAKAWTANDRLSVIWQSDLTDEIKRSFFQAVIVSIVLYVSTTWTLIKRMKRKLDGNCTRMLRVVLKKYRGQQPTKQQLYVHLQPIKKTIQVRRTRHALHWWACKDELISYVLLCSPLHRRAKVERPARTYLQQLCADIACSLEDISGMMDGRVDWWVRVREILASSAIWWWASYSLLLTCGTPKEKISQDETFFLLLKTTSCFLARIKWSIGF